MGTRHIIGVVVDGDFKVAQYGQWDGYPGGQGVDVLNFLSKADLDRFRAKVRAVRWVNEEDQAAADAKWREVGADPDSGWVTMDQADEFYADPRFAPLNRDVGAKILDLIDAEKVTFLRDDRDFALDSLFCEWAYVVDLDRDMLEVYEGFQKSPPSAGRWRGQAANDGGYYPVELVAEYKLNDLPDLNTFVKELEPDEDE